MIYGCPLPVQLPSPLLIHQSQSEGKCLFRVWEVPRLLFPIQAFQGGFPSLSLSVMPCSPAPGPPLLLLQVSSVFPGCAFSISFGEPSLSWSISGRALLSPSPEVTASPALASARAWCCSVPASGSPPASPSHWISPSLQCCAHLLDSSPVSHGKQGLWVQGPAYPWPPAV